MTADDILADDIESAPEATDDQLKKISSLVRLYGELERNVAAAQDALTKANDSFKKLTDVDLPEAMSAAGYAPPTKMLLAGAQVEFVTFVSASITKANALLAHAWLVDNGHPDLIKAEAKFAFPRGTEKFRKQFMEAFKALVKKSKKLPSIKVTEKEGVHPQTLGAFVREQMALGVAIPRDLFSVYEGRSVTVKPVAPPGQ